MILFCIIWGVTFGKHHFWLLPNLTEDVGFFDSFRPLYKHEVVTDQKDSSKTDKDKPESLEAVGSSDTVKKDADEEENKTDEDKGESASGSEEVDNENGYEIVDPEEVEDPEEVPDEDVGDDVDGETKKTK